MGNFCNDNGIILILKRKINTIVDSINLVVKVVFSKVLHKDLEKIGNSLNFDDDLNVVKVRHFIEVEIDLNVFLEVKKKVKEVVDHQLEDLILIEEVIILVIIDIRVLLKDSKNHV